MNGFSPSQIAGKIQEEPYRFLVCADKFQTGYDEPLLHTMYVDKMLSGVKAVQTMSRLNRAHPKKHDAFVLDFMNDAETIQEAFADYYRTTVLAEETDANRLHDLQATLDDAQVYSQEQLDALVEQYLGGADRESLDPILDRCVEVYREDLDEDQQVEFKGRAKAFLRSYGFMATILSYTYADWEKLSIFLTFLVPKLPAPEEDDLSKGILEAIDMDSYRVEKQAVQEIQLADEDAEIDPVATEGGGRRRKRNWTGCRRSCRTLMTGLGIPSGRTRTGSSGTSPKSCPRRWPKIGPIRTRWRIRTSRTRGLSTTKRYNAP
jgi:type I restriction enzyme R subunit